MLEPSKIHYYQPAFTLIGAGIMKMKHSHRPLPKIVPRGVTWLHDAALNFDPCDNMVYTENGDKIQYEYMVVAVGINNDYDQITGLKRALKDPKVPVTTIYSPEYCQKTWKCIKQFTGGHALFTFPPVGGKCSGASMKIMFLAHDYWRQKNILKKTSITYNTSSDKLFGIPKYAIALRRLVMNRRIVPNYCAELVQVAPREATFLCVGGQTLTFPYNMLHVTPPMSPPACLRQCQELTNEAGFLDVDLYSLQHRRFPNVFGVGDCMGTPNSKTAAAVAPQSYVVERNLGNVMSGKPPVARYSGYGACPLITSYKKGMLAEFAYDKKVCETFPFDQSKERRILFQLNKRVFPHLYWKALVKGKWNGSATIRHIINPLRL
ncbi:unnamed protein product [Chrysodeixis includens]|uniref:Sulfide:quinone oxidoreductase, mitochondrial n=1 Tax=Chrysodeixis includens TaxID=689277 RepID=A0A9P0FRE5_CHRIL|nr:unnamed protein product [Chrysodeixis includens]